MHKRRADMVRDAIDAAAGGPREQVVEAIVSAITAGGLFVVDVDIIHSQIGQNAHVILSAGESNEMNPEDMVAEGFNPRDFIEIINDNGVSQGMAFPTPTPTPTAKPGQVAIVFGSPADSQGNVVGAGVNELVLPNGKHCWDDIRKILGATREAAGIFGVFGAFRHG